MATVEVGTKKKKKSLNTEVSGSVNANRVSGGANQATSDTNALTEEQQKAQQLSIMKAQNPDAVKAQEHQETLKNRNWAQKLFGIDPDSNWFFNSLSAATFGLNWFDNAAWAAAYGLTGKGDKAAEVFNKAWNENRSTGFSDFAANTFTGGKWEDFSDWAQNSGGPGWAKTALGIGTDILTSPTNLALIMLAPFTGGASGAAAINKTARGALETIRSAEGVSKTAQAANIAQDASKTGKYAKELSAAQKFAGSESNIKGWIQAFNNGTLDPKNMSSYERAFYDYAVKNAKNGKLGKQAQNAILTAQYQGNQWLNNVGEGVDALDNWISNVGRFNLQNENYAKIGQNIRNIFQWSTMPGFKALGATGKGIATGVSNLGNSTALGSKTARKVVQGVEKSKQGVANKFNKGRGLSSATKQATYIADNEVNKVAQESHKQLKAIDRGVQQGASDASRKARGLDISNTEKARGFKLNPSDKSSDVLINDLTNELASNKDFVKAVKEADEVFRTATSSDKEALGNLVKSQLDSRLSETGQGSLGSRAITNTTKEYNAFAKEFNDKLITQKMSSDNIKNKAVAKKLLKDEGKLKALLKVPEQLDNIALEKALQDQSKWLKVNGFDVNQLTKDKISDLFDRLAENPNLFEELSKADQDLLEHVVQPYFRQLSNSTISRTDNAALSFLTHTRDTTGATAASKTGVIGRFSELLKDNTKFRNEILGSYLKQSDPTLVNVSEEQLLKQFTKFSQDPQNLENAIEYFNSTYASKYAQQYLDSVFRNPLGETSQATRFSNVVGSLIQNGNFTTADVGRTTKAQLGAYQTAVKNNIGKDLSGTDARKVYNQAVKSVQKFQSTELPQIEKQLADIGIVKPSKNVNLTKEALGKELDNYYAQVDKRLPQSYKDQLKLIEDADNALRDLRYIGDLNTQDIFSTLNNTIGEQYYESRVNELQSEFVKKNLDKEVKKIASQSKQLEKDIAKIDAEITKKLGKDSSSDISKLTKQRDKLKAQLSKTKSMDKTKIEAQLNTLFEKGGSYGNESLVGRKETINQLKQSEKLFESIEASDFNSNAQNFRSYGIQGRVIQATETGQQYLKDTFSTLFDGSKESKRALSYIQGKTNLSEKQLLNFQAKTGLKLDSMKYLADEKQLTDLTRLSEEISRATGWAATEIPIKALEDSANYMRNITKSQIATIAQRQGINLNNLSVTDGWIRDVRDWDLFDWAMKQPSFYDATTQKLNAQALRLSNEKVFAKNLTTMGINTNILSGNPIMSLDSLSNIEKQLNMVASDFKISNVLKTSLQNNDIKVLSNFETNKYFGGLQIKESKRQAGVLSLIDGSEVSNKLPNGKLVLSAKDIEDSLRGISHLVNQNEIAQITNTLDNSINYVKGKDLAFSKLSRDAQLATTYLEVPQQLSNLINSAGKSLTDPFKSSTLGAFRKITNAANGVWKQLALLTPGYQSRNFVSNEINSYVAGVPVGKKTVQTFIANKDITAFNGIIDPFSGKVIKQGIKHKIEDAWNALNNTKLADGSVTRVTYDRAINQLLFDGTLTSKEAEIGREILTLQHKSIIGGFNIRSEYGGFLDTNNILAHNITQQAKANGQLTHGAKQFYNHTLGGITNANMRIGAAIDDAHRLALYRMAQKDPNLVTKLGLRTPEEFVRHIAFDFQNMTDFEKNVMRPLIPFYTYLRQSVEYHLKNIPQNGTYYAKAVRTLQEASYDYEQQVDKNGLPKWIMNAGYVPLGSRDGRLRYSTIPMPWNNVETLVNTIGDSIQTAINPDTINQARVKNDYTNILGNFNPVVKAAVATGAGESTIGKENNNVFLNALVQEVGGVFTKLPDLVKRIVDGQSEGDEISDAFGTLFGLWKTLPQESIESQRVYELLKYLQNELEKYDTDYLPNYEVLKKQMYGVTPKQLGVGNGRSVKYRRATNRRKLKTIKDDNEFL